LARRQVGRERSRLQKGVVQWRAPYGEMSHFKMLPSEYFFRQGFCAVECDEECVSHVVAALGDVHLVTTTDYPHGDFKYPEAMDSFLALDLKPESGKMVL